MSQVIKLNCDTLEAQVRSACLLEAAAPKFGNVTPAHNFDDMSFAEFATAAQITGTQLAQVAPSNIGFTVLEVIKKVKAVVSVNVNLGIVLLITPLAACDPDRPLESEIGTILNAIDLEQTNDVYAAIRLAKPAGLGSRTQEDVSQPATMRLKESMTLAAGHDLIARQYASNFEDVLKFGRDRLRHWDARDLRWQTTIVGLQLEFLSRFLDSHIVRKLGAHVAEDVRSAAERCLQKGWPLSASGQACAHDFDRWLRDPSERKNPGTTADLIAAVVFAAIRDRQWCPPAFIEI